VDAGLSLVPRAVWPNKPMSAGSGDLVSRYTGLRFAEGTSVGIGQVLEFYINFGTIGVFLGLFAFGMLLSTADRLAFRALDEGNVGRFTVIFLPCLSFLQVGGSLVEVLSAAGASLVMAVGFRALIDRRTLRRAAGMAAEADALAVPPTS
jgi:hypothetical protein